MNKNIIIYSKPNCMQCLFTKQFLTDKNVEFTEKDIEADEQAMNEVKALGFTSLPVVVGEGFEPFSGFRPDQLEKI